MKVGLKKLPKSQLELLIELTSQEFESFSKKTLTDLSKELEIKGFRKGKVPEEIAREHLKEKEILVRAIQRAVEESYLKAIIEQKIEAISQPEIEIVKNPSKDLLSSVPKKEDFVPALIFRARSQVLPHFDLPDYRKFAANTQRKEVRVEENEVEDTLNWLQKSRAKFSQIQKPCQKGDFVEIEFSSPQIKEIENQKDSFVLGQGRFLPGFEENLEGMAAGEEREFFLTFPKEHLPKNLSDKEVQFRVKMKTVQKIELPPLDDQFARNLGRFENLQNLKENVKEGILKEKEFAESQRVRQEILEKIVKAIDFEAPDILVEKEKERMFHTLKQNVEKQFGLPFSDYLKSIQKLEAELKESFEKPAQGVVKSFLVLRALSQKENIEVTESEVEAKINEILKRYPSKEKAKKEIDLEQLKDYIKEVVTNEKTLVKLESFAKNDKFQMTNTKSNPKS